MYFYIRGIYLCMLHGYTYLHVRTTWYLAPCIVFFKISKLKQNNFGFHTFEKQCSSDLAWRTEWRKSFVVYCYTYLYYFVPGTVPGTLSTSSLYDKNLRPVLICFELLCYFVISTCYRELPGTYVVMVRIYLALRILKKIVYMVCFEVVNS